MNILKKKRKNKYNIDCLLAVVAVLVLVLSQLLF